MSESDQDAHNAIPANHTLGGWCTERRLGDGGMGVVYLARRGADVAALKVIRPELAEDPAFRLRFAREVAAARRVEGRNIARVIEADPDAPQPWMAVEYVQGLSLESAIRHGGSLQADRLLALAGQLATGLAAIHRSGVVHRDLKPGNVILGPDEAKIVDFGVARSSDATALTAVGSVIGSAHYMSPEQAQGQHVDAPTDIFAWAATCLFSATGRPPFGEGPAPAVLYRVVNTTPVVPDSIPEPLRYLLQAALSPDPSARPTAEWLCAGLSSGSGVPPTLVTAVAPTQEHDPTTATVRPSRRSSWLQTIPVVAFIAITVAFAATYFLGTSGSPRPRSQNENDQQPSAAPTPTRVTTSTAAHTTSPATSTPPLPSTDLTLVPGQYGFLVPAGWSHQPLTNGGGPASIGSYSNPDGPGFIEYVVSGGAHGVIYKEDGTPNILAALSMTCATTGTTIINDWIAGYRCADTADGLEVNGVTAIFPAEGGWTSLIVTLSSSQHSSATQILNSFVALHKDYS